MENSTERSFVEIQNDAISVLKTIYDPEIPVDIYELGLIYEIKVSPGGNMVVVMTLTSPACPVAGTLPGEVEGKLKGIAGVNDVKVDLTFDPPWSQELMSEEAKLELGFL
jgi:FeS assembly SUF system protein